MESVRPSGQAGASHPAGKFPHPNDNAGSDTPREGKCGSKLRGRPGFQGKDRFCMAPRMKGRKRCRVHGGKALQGWAHPKYKGAARHKFGYLPAELQPVFDASKQDPERMELLDHIDLVNAKLSDLFARMAQAGLATGKLNRDGKASPCPPWLELRDAWDQVMRATPNTAPRRMAEARMGAIVNAGAGSDQGWQQAVALMEVLRRLVETQTRRDEKNSQYVAVEKVQMLFRQVGASIQKHVRDRGALAAMQSDLLQLVSPSRQKPQEQPV